MNNYRHIIESQKNTIAELRDALAVYLRYIPCCESCSDSPKEFALVTKGPFEQRITEEEFRTVKKAEALLEQ